MSFADLLRKGTFYYPAYKHYQPGAVVICDNCNQKTEACIGYLESDLCLQCANSIIEYMYNVTRNLFTANFLAPDDDAEERSQQVYAQVERLKQEGHTCTMLLESYPPQISWCQQLKCTNNLSE